MNIFFTKKFEKKLSKLTSKNPSLKKSLSKQFKLFASDPNHPSLKTHKLQGERSQQYSIWIEANLRAVAVKSPDGFVFFDLVTHDQY